MRFKLLDKIAPQNRILFDAEEVALAVIKREEEFRSKTDAELKQYTDYFIDYLAQNKSMDDILVETLCVIREAFYRTYGMLAYKCQLIGAIVVHRGDFAEMMTGEGKTLTLVLAAYVNALYKKGVHLVTVNEYLVQRDAEFAEGVLNKLGITCGYVTSAMSPYEKKMNYAKDITYVSNTELGFDYLRDNLVKHIDDKVQRDLFFAIIDEADSVLIDEARTPLIIAGQPNHDTSDYVRVDRFVKSLDQDDYVLDLESHSITLSDSGAAKAQEFFNVENIYDIQYSDIVHKISNSLRANYIFTNGVEYIVRPNQMKNNEPEIVLVDAFTGRIMEGRSYSAGLQQAIQAKEMVEIEPENMTIATITYQSFFRIYKKIAGVSGTAATEAEEILNFYNMVVVQIPTNKPSIRFDYPDYIFDTKKIKWKYVVAEIKKRHKTGQPILIGTGSVEDSEVLHLLLSRLGIQHTVLNAKNHALEAEIIKNAGQKGAITIATNMAGRGTDIKLGEGVRELGGLYVIGTERAESRRVDNQLRGRSGRQGDPGESRFFISLQDSLFKRFAIDFESKSQDKISEDVIDTKFFSKLLNMTQAKIEGLNYDVRKSIIDFDYVVSSQRELFYKQRDIILKSENVVPILSRMGIYVVDQILNNHIDEINTDIVDLEKVVEEFNNEIFNFDFLTISEFESSAISVVKTHLLEKLSMYIKTLAEEGMLSFFNVQAKDIILAKMDERWSWFLEKVAKTREGVNLRAYEQKSPLNIFVSDVDKFFKSMISQIAYQTILEITKRHVQNAQPMGNKTLSEYINEKIQESIKNNQIESNDVINVQTNNEEYFQEFQPFSVEEEIRKIEEQQQALLEEENKPEPVMLPNYQYIPEEFSIDDEEYLPEDYISNQESEEVSKLDQILEANREIDQSQIEAENDSVDEIDDIIDEIIGDELLEEVVPQPIKEETQSSLEKEEIDEVINDIITEEKEIIEVLSDDIADEIKEVIDEPSITSTKEEVEEEKEEVFLYYNDDLAITTFKLSTPEDELFLPKVVKQVEQPIKEEVQVQEVTEKIKEEEKEKEAEEVQEESEEVFLYYNDDLAITTFDLSFPEDELLAMALRNAPNLNKNLNCDKDVESLNKEPEINWEQYIFNEESKALIAELAISNLEQTFNWDSPFEDTILK